MRQSPIQKKGAEKYLILLADTRFLTGPVIAHPGIDGGVFDHGITGEGVVHIDLGEANWFQKAQFTQPFKEWAAEVQVCANRHRSSA